MSTDFQNPRVSARGAVKIHSPAYRAFHFWRHDHPPDWPTADRAYQQHHTACPHCRAAGTSPNTQQRCPDGAQLWGTYQQAGDPPHFTWLRKRPGRSLPT